MKSSNSNFNSKIVIAERLKQISRLDSNILRVAVSRAWNFVLYLDFNKATERVMWLLIFRYDNLWK